MTDEQVTEHDYQPVAFISGLQRDAERAGAMLPVAKRLLRALLESRANHHDIPDHLCEYSHQSDDALWANERYANSRRIASGMAPLLAREGWEMDVYDDE